VIAEFELDPNDDLGCFRVGQGCAICRGRGKIGRLAIHEVLYVSPEMAAAISRRAPATEVMELAKAAGYRPLIEDGLEKARQGLVTLEDVLACARVD
jgi:type IV pilus assembly protein PilB